ncbi:CDP-alcohol phosphatidyltransferase family protein [Altererythrobacter sp. TH136]|uniref:CDP-alcohol phosphatidyltransferase family protein n=1 Tax=Altererythrobacter sp. TH136 TaxID=2067415 RepID=UPI001164152A|nr:CDP-alcohol phosphatidyltransferase family protein [Altererythrobacter sp. TH136]QDM40470.1 CDP-alcohol phosphatidyltransferase family protein [Altererythrobacter sp. TH136]
MTRPLDPAPPRRIQRNLLASGEKHLLAWLCPRLPAWVTPDGLTALALLSAVAIGLGYALSTWNPWWLALSVAGYFTHWFGDSLDGTIARYRRVERPRYGYFIDHSCDGLATLLILGGLGVSPYLQVEVALFAVVAYLLMSVHTFLLAKVAGEFPLSHLGAGPTELRIVLIALTVIMGFLGPDVGRVAGFNGFDILFTALATLLVVLFMVQTVREGRTLAALDRGSQKIR